MNVQPGTSSRRLAAFTLVELLIVITIIAVLIVLGVAVYSKAIDRQQRDVTQSIMSNVMLAIDEFKEEHNTPFRAIYDKRNAATFGVYPPYQLARPTNNPRSTAQILEPLGVAPTGLKERLARDVFADPAAATNTNRISLDTDPIAGLHDDNRALYTYLRLYASKALAQVPQNAIKPLTNGTEFLNQGSNLANEDSRVEVLGIHDGWGVPFDYMLYLKLEWGQVVDPNTGQVSGGVRIVDRMPVLVSRGVSAEVFAAQVAAYQANSNPAVFDKTKMIFSPAFPTPPANVDAQGVFQGTNSGSNGWVRARALGDFFGYVPSQDN